MARRVAVRFMESPVSVMLKSLCDVYPETATMSSTEEKRRRGDDHLVEEPGCCWNRSR
jgi:hypothetical protein